jgi:hypothetical protein
LENSAEAWGRTTTLSTGVNEFKACEVYSLNRLFIPEAVMTLSKVFTMEAPQSTSISAAPEMYNVASLITQNPSTTAQNGKNATDNTSKRKHTEWAASPPSPSSALPPAITVDEV